jgi:hypothetical protein
LGFQIPASWFTALTYCMVRFSFVRLSSRNLALHFVSSLEQQQVRLLLLCGHGVCVQRLFKSWEWKCVEQRQNGVAEENWAKHNGGAKPSWSATHQPISTHSDLWSERLLHHFPFAGTATGFPALFIFETLSFIVPGYIPFSLCSYQGFVPYRDIS